MKPLALIIVAVLGTIVLVFALALVVGCTPDARAKILAADKALCIIPHVLSGKEAATVAGLCDEELPIVEAVVRAAGDAGTP